MYTDEEEKQLEFGEIKFNEFGQPMFKEKRLREGQMIFLDGQYGEIERWNHHEEYYESEFDWDADHDYWFFRPEGTIRQYELDFGEAGIWKDDL